MKTLVWSRLDPKGRADALARPDVRGDEPLSARVREIVGEVRLGGWESLCAIARQIDGAEPVEAATAGPAESARRKYSGEEISAIELAAANIRAFHEAARPEPVTIEPVDGLVVGKAWRALDRVGLYVPGGSTPLFSTLLMLAIPARVAGVGEIIVVTPPGPDGGLDPLIGLAAQLCGIERIWTVGGAQAIAALAHGAGPIPRVDKICGPGNAFVAEAKRLVSSERGGPTIDLPAGPSELMVIADETADPAMVAADLLSQAEHDRAAQVMLVTPSAELGRMTEAEIKRQVEALPRVKIARASLECGRTLIVEDIESAIEIANLYAPEHLSLALADADRWTARVRNAGSIFVGALAAESFGDYLAGPSHVLPTDGAARSWGGVSVNSFMKAISIQSVSAAAARRLARPAALLARLEGLEAHARAADARAQAGAVPAGGVQ